MDDYSRILSKRILTLCEEQNCSINRLATLAGIRQSTLQNIVKENSKNPSIKTLNKIATKLEIDIGDLFDFSVQPNKQYFSAVLSSYSCYILKKGPSPPHGGEGMIRLFTPAPQAGRF